MASSSGSNSNNIEHATYPLPQPLAFLIETSIASTDANLRAIPEEESKQTALSQFTSNALQAVDRLYFSESPNIRTSDWFHHRTCLRLHVVPHTSLTITDLGTGMTRADLINALGIGRLSRKAQDYVRVAMEVKKDSSSSSELQEGEESAGGVDNDDGRASAEDGEHTESDDVDRKDDEDGETVDTDVEGDDDDGDDDAETTDNEEEEDDDEDGSLLPCTETDIGGFYAALCALGVGVTIGTKSKFDDYYEFSFGQTPNSNDINDDNESSTSNKYSHFTIARPMDEGTMPTVENGYDQMHQVRGESGTSVTIYCNSEDGDWMTEDTIRPLVTKIMETSQYTVAFSSDGDAAKIIAASRVELDERAKLAASVKEGDHLDDDAGDDDINGDSATIPLTRASVKERSKYIPLRLTLGERKMLRLVEAAMTCCDYTSAVDHATKTTKARRTHAQLQGISSILKGLVTACDYEAGQKLSTEEDDLETYQAFFVKIFEIARRHKIMNPEKMRTEYGKLIYLLQDAVSPTVQPHLGFSVVGPIVTVYDFLKERGGVAVLEDKAIDVATEEITGGKNTRAQISNDIKRKETAVSKLKSKYRSRRLSEDDIHLALYSIGDNNSFLNSNRVPIDKIIDYLSAYFSPAKMQEGYSLSILSGENGARLSHNHERQYYFALQSLTLWRDIIDDMFRLWQMAEDDLLSETVTYTLQDTGQGLQRVQQSPRTYRAMQQILQSVQQTKVKQWIGSSMIHMGDHNVPNSLSFIDKYTQVPRILSPIVACLENLEKMYDEHEDITQLVDDNFGGLEKLRKDILHDFFRSAFDGSGADNFYDAGSCIDGRLTSAWNWCSQLPTKPYYCIFKLTGFVGFDGDFK